MKSFLIICITAILLLPACKKNESSAPPIITPPVTPPPVVQLLTEGWSKKFIGTPYGLNDIFFNTPLNGYAIGPRIFKTTDGGNTWNLVYSAFECYNAFVTADNKAFFVAVDRIVKTLDGGQSFSQFPLDAQLVNDIFFVDNNTGYYIGREGLYATTDAGISWSKILTSGLSIAPSSYSTLFLRSNGIGWICNAKSIYKTNGSNINWQLATFTGVQPSGGFTSVFATSANIIYAATSHSEVFKSIDGGVSFTLIARLAGIGYADLHFINDNLGYVSGNNQIHKTVDGGINWLKVVEVDYLISEIHFTDSTHGWASGDSGMVLTYKP